MWKLENSYRIIVVNYSDLTSQCRLVFHIDSPPETITLIDLLNNQKYVRKTDEIMNLGLFVELKSYNSHIFSIEK